MKATKVNSVDRDFTGIMEFLTSHQLFLQGEEEGRRASFMHIDFSGFDFSNFNLSRAIFKNCNLSKTIFSQEVLDEIIFDGCNFSESSFLCKEVKNSSFSNCVANSIFLSNLSFEACNFNNFSSNSGVFTKSQFYKCNFEKMLLQDVNLNSSQFQECRLQDVSFIICDFAYSNVIKSNFQKADFLGSDLFSCNFHYSIFTEGRFKSAIFNSGNNVIKTSLKNVKFQDCKLQKCFFEERQQDLTKLITKTKYKEKQSKASKIYLTAFFISKALILASTVSFFILKTISNFAFDKVLYSIAVISLAGLLTINEVSFKKIHFTNLVLLKSKVFTLLPALLSFLTFFTIWFQSLKYEDFTFSLSILLLFSLGAFYSYSYLLSVKSFLKSSYNKNK